MIPESQIIIRLLVAALLGLIIGYERERQDHAAGLRTHMILVIGAALAMAVSINLAFWLGVDKPVGDPARLAAQVVSGIGFIGGGVIFRYGTNVRGLTTAASLWTAAMIGLVTGAGLYLAGITATVILLVVLSALNYIEDHFLPSYNRVHVIMQANYRPGIVDEVEGLVNQGKRNLNSIGIDRDLVAGKITLDADVRIWSEYKVEDFVNELAGIQGVNQIKLSE